MKEYREPLSIEVEKYEAEFASRTMFVLQVELTHVISDRWYDEKLKNNTIN